MCLEKNWLKDSIYLKKEKRIGFKMKETWKKVNIACESNEF